MNLLTSLIHGLPRSLSSSLRLRKERAYAEELEISAPVLSLRASVSKVSARVDGKQLFFSTPDGTLNPSAEALGSAFLIPSMHAQRRLKIHPQVCSTWAQNIATIQPLLESWWGYQPNELALRSETRSVARNERSALAFSCGVDSFYSLLKYPKQLDALVSVLGFDIDLKDRSRTNSLKASVRVVAAEAGKKPIFLSTNLRRFRSLKRASWERTHGGALAAIGHLLSDTYSTFVISSSVPKRLDNPCGSRWDLDPKFESAALTIEHFGEHSMRASKLVEIASEPIVRQHLRVCWEHRSKDANCGLCEKCVRTMLTLDSCGELGRSSAFPNSQRLADSISQIPFTSKLTFEGYELLLRSGISPQYRVPTQRMLERSRAHYNEDS